MKSVVEDAAKKFEACKDVFATASSGGIGGDAAGGAAAIAQLLERVKADASKVGIMHDSSPAEMEGILGTLQRTLTALCAVLHAHTEGAGQTLKDGLKAAAQKLGEQCAELAKALLVTGDVAAATKAAVGKVWDQCDHVKATPLTNSAAIFKRLALVTRVVKDTLREIGEIEEESSGGGVIEEGDEREEEEEDDSCNGSRPGAEAWQGDGSTAEPTEAEQGQGHGKNGGEGEEREEGEDHEESDSVMDFKVGPLSREDAEVVASAKGLLEVAVKTLTTIARPLITGPVEGGAEVEAWESLAWHCKGLQRGAEDVTAALYPPQDLDEIKEAAEGLTISLECMLDEVPERHMAALSDALRTLQTDLESAGSRLTASLGVNDLVVGGQ